MNLPNVIYFIGCDRWDRPMFQSESGRYFVDTNCGKSVPRYCTVCHYGNPYYGEPDIPMPGSWKPTVIQASEN